MKRWILIALILLATAVAAVSYRLAQREGTQPVSVTVATDPQTSAAGATKAYTKNIEPKEFPDSAQQEIQKCLGAGAGNFAELEALVAAEAGSPTSEQLEWKVVQFEDQGGKPFRIRLAREFTEAGKPELRLSLFAIDEEGLPSRVPLPVQEVYQPDLEAMGRVLHDKRISSEIESQRYFYPGEKELTLEKENGIVQKLQFAGGNVRLSCDAAAGNPSCHCVR
ncbi:MAG: hypothetical protein AB7K68_14465 [Bacteriovoracia bacterium]